MCCCGLNTIVNLPANIADKTDGTPVDVSGLQGRKTIEISGTYQGTYSVFGSHDGSLYFPLAYFNSGASSQTVRKTLEVVVHFLRVHREAPVSDLVTINVAGRATTTCRTACQSGANNFFSLASLPPGSSGPQPALDLFSLVSANGVDASSVGCGGSFHGQISVESSLDKVNFSPLGGFTPSRAQRHSGADQLTFDPLIVNEISRYIRANVLPGTVIVGPTSLTMGGPQNCPSPGNRCNGLPTIENTVANWPFQGSYADISGNGLDMVSVNNATDAPTTPAPFTPVADKTSGFVINDPCLVGVDLDAAGGFTKLLAPASPLLILTGACTFQWIMMWKFSFVWVQSSISSLSNYIFDIRTGSSDGGAPAIYHPADGEQDFPGLTRVNWSRANLPNSGDYHPFFYTYTRSASGHWTAYKNGIAGGAGLSSTPYTSNGTERFYLGGYAGQPGGQGCAGHYSAVRILNVERSADDILADAQFLGYA